MRYRIGEEYERGNKMRKYCKALANLTITLASFLVIIFLLPKALVLFAPFVAGWIIAAIARPMVRFLEEKVKLKRRIGSAFVIVLVIGLVVLLIYLIGAKLVEQVMGLIHDLPSMWAGFSADIKSMGDKLEVILARFPGDFKKTIDNLGTEIGTAMGAFFEKLGTPTIEAAGNFAKQLPTIFIAVIMALLSAYFFVADRAVVNEWFKNHTPASLQMRWHMIYNSLVKSVGGYFKAQCKIEIWMYLLLVIGLGILKVDYFALIALGIAFLDFFPVLGTGTVMVPWAIIKIFNADYITAIWLLVIWGGGQLLRQLIQPKIMGDSMGVPPIPTLILLYVGYKIGGMLGMIFAVPLGLLLYALYQDGAFDTTKNSFLILVAGVNRFRRLNDQDLAGVEEMAARNEEVARELEQRRNVALVAEAEKREKNKK